MQLVDHHFRDVDELGWILPLRLAPTLLNRGCAQLRVVVFAHPRDQILDVECECRVSDFALGTLEAGLHQQHLVW